MGSRSKLLMTSSLLAACIALSSCGAKKSVGTDDSLGGSSPRESSEVGGTQAEPGETGDNNPMDPDGDIPKASEDNSVEDVVSVPDVKLDDYNPKANNIDVEKPEKRLTGGANREGLLYTASGTDDIAAYFKERNNQVGAGQRQANINFAGTVANAEILKLGGDSIVRVQMIEGNNVATYDFAADLTPSLSAASRIERSDSGRANLGLEVKCLDLDGGCDNVLLRMMKQDNGGKAIANIIVRESVSDLYFELAPHLEQSNNPEFLRWKKYLINSKYSQMSLERVDNIIMKSFEVVNGRSEVKLEMRMYDNEFVGITGPLLAPEVGTRVNIPFSLVRADEIDSADLTTASSASYTLMNSLAGVRLVNNNGLGQIRIQLAMRQVSNFKQDRINLVLLRKLKPMISAQEALK